MQQQQPQVTAPSSPAGNATTNTTTCPDAPARPTNTRPQLEAGALVNAHNIWRRVENALDEAADVQQSVQLVAP